MSQTTAATQSRSRSRSRSQSLARASTLVARRGNFAFMAGPRRSLKWNGEYAMTRMCYQNIAYTQNGFFIGTANFQAIGIVFNLGSVNIVTTTIGPTQSQTIPNYAELIGLWDRVHLSRVKIDITCTCTDPPNSSTFTSTPIIFYASDNSDVVGNTLEITQQQQDVKSFKCSSSLPTYTINVYPKYQRIVYYTSLLSSYEPASGFVASNTDIPHYGLRLAMPLERVGFGNLQVSYTYFYKCKDVK
jgi:hypothetical protein